MSEEKTISSFFSTVGEDINEAMEGVEAIANFSNVVFFVDGTHIRILCTPRDEKYAFVCSKSYRRVNDACPTI